MRRPLVRPEVCVDEQGNSASICARHNIIRNDVIEYLGGRITTDADASATDPTATASLNIAGDDIALHERRPGSGPSCCLVPRAAAQRSLSCLPLRLRVGSRVTDLPPAAGSPVIG